MSPFIVLGLPRSRTAWLAKFLSYEEWICGHDEVRHARSLDDVKTWFAQPFVGSCETAAAPFWRMLLRMGVRIVTVRRPVAEVVESLAAFGFDPAVMAPAMRKLDRKLDQIEARTGCLSVTFEELGTPQGAARIFEECTGHPFDRGWWERRNAENVQCDMAALVRYAQAFKPQIEKLTVTAKRAELKELMTRKPVEPEGITFQVEDCATWQRDARALFEDHCTVVGEDPREWATKNWDMMQALDDAGAMQITTARCNGRMFGYLMTLICPSLVANGRTNATHTTFYADPSFPGLGMKLQREALAHLKARGVDEVFWEAGQRGDGPRLGTMYRRLGAAPHGETYRLELTEH